MMKMDKIYKAIQHTKQLFALVALLCIPAMVSAFTVQQDGLTYTSFKSNGTTQVSVKLSDFTKTSVEIPATIEHEGKSYAVTKIEDCGFTQYLGDTSPLMDVENEYSYNCDNEQVSVDLTGYYNGTLEKVTFVQPSNIQRIGAKAFEGCVGLKTFTIPNSVTDLGTEAETTDQPGRAFFACTNLTQVLFQTKDDGTVDLTIIPDQTFATCYRLAGIEIPEGVTEIKPYAFQFNFALTSIKLPNTLTTIGAHFLCDASSLQTLTIPASVTYINGAFLHGCESLKTVYLLGSPGVLSDVVEGQDAVSPFTANPTNYCKGYVQNCKFYVSSEYYDTYTTQTGWKDVHKPNNQHDNEYVKIENTRVFTGGRWVTAIFPHEVESKTEAFGEGTMAAEMISAVPTAQDKTLYHVTFKLLPGDEIPENTPLMFYPATTTTYKLFEANEIEDQNFKAKMTEKFTERVTATDGAIVSMIGLYSPLPLAYLDFYFMRNSKKSAEQNKDVYEFYRVPSGAAITLGAFRCYWQIKVDNVLSEAKGFTFEYDESGLTGISDISTKQPEASQTAYTIDGRCVNTSTESLPKGLYIIGGKKIVVK